MTRVSNFAQSEALMAEVLKVQQRLFDSQRQVVTGKIAEFYKDIPRDTLVLLGAKTVESRTVQYQRTGIELTRKLEIYDIQTNELAAISVELRQEMLSAIATTSGLSIMDRIDALFARTSRVLNTTLDGNYLFGGVRTDQPPVNTTTLAGLLALTVAADAFDNSQSKLKVQVDDTFTITYGVLADKAGEPIFAAIKRIADFNAGASGPFSSQLTEVQKAFLTGELAAMLQVIDDLQLEVAQVGTDQTVLEGIAVRHGETINFTKIFIIF